MTATGSRRSRFTNSLLFKGLQTFSRWGQSCTTGVFVKDSRELVFVPGNTITLGWEQFSEGLDEDNLAELNYVFGEYEYIGTPEDFIREDMAPVCQATISPMLVGRELEEIGWEPIDFQDPRLLAHPDWLKEFEDYKRSENIGLNLVGFLPCSPHRTPEVQEDDLLDIDFDFCRPIIRVE